MSCAQSLSHILDTLHLIYSTVQEEWVFPSLQKREWRDGMVKDFSAGRKPTVNILPR